MAKSSTSSLSTSNQADRDAAWGNERIQVRSLSLELQRQDGLLAIDAVKEARRLLGLPPIS